MKGFILNLFFFFEPKIEYLKDFVNKFTVQLTPIPPTIETAGPKTSNRRTITEAK